VPIQGSAITGTEAETLRELPTFRHFKSEELAELVGLMRRWDAPKSALLCAEGDPGGTCFVVVSGAVDVSASIGGRQRLLATLAPGSIFGQVSLINAAPRSATCSVRRDAVLMELERATCERLFGSRSSTALKFLAAMNQGLIAALRGADRRLMRLTNAHGPDAHTVGPPLVSSNWLFDGSSETS
jgi:CRP-like cAMP-binding protein